MNSLKAKLNQIVIIHEGNHSYPIDLISPQFAMLKPAPYNGPHAVYT